MPMIRFFACWFVGMILLFLWIPFARENISIHAWWGMAVMMGVGIALVGASAAIGGWWSGIWREDDES